MYCWDPNANPPFGRVYINTSNPVNVTKVARFIGDAILLVLLAVLVGVLTTINWMFS